MGKRANGEGTIYKRTDGRWCGAYYDAEFNRRYVYGKTQAEARKKLKAMQETRTVKNKAYTVEEWIMEFLSKYKKNDIKITTYNSYMILYRKHIQNSKIGKIKLTKLQVSDLQHFYNKKLKDGYSSKSVRSVEVIINSALEMAFKLRMIPENPNQFTTIPKKEKYEAKVLTLSEVEKIVSEAKEAELYPIVVTTVYTGLRKGEVMALKWENIDFEGRRIFIKNSLCRVGNEIPDEKGRYHVSYQIMEPKTRKSVRTVPMLDEVYFALQEQKRRQELDKERYGEVYMDQGLVFADTLGGFLPQRQFMDKYHQFLKDYGITDIRFHDLRHTFASLLVESDVSLKLVQELLGHSTIATSMDLYTHVSEQKKTQAMQQLKIGNGNNNTTDMLV